MSSNERFECCGCGLFSSEHELVDGKCPRCHCRVQPACLGQFNELADVYELTAGRERADALRWFMLGRSSRGETSAECAGCAKLEKDMEKELETRDANAAYADQLVEMIGVYFETDHGEHTSGNFPWENAIETMRVAIGTKQSAAETPVPTWSTKYDAGAWAVTRGDGFKLFHFENRYSADVLVCQLRKMQERDSQVKSTAPLPDRIMKEPQR